LIGCGSRTDLIRPRIFGIRIELAGCATRAEKDDLILAVVVEVDEITAPAADACIAAPPALDAAKLSSAHLRDDGGGRPARLVTKRDTALLNRG